MPPIAASKPKRNNYISYIKGWAIISIICIHLLDWSNIILTKTQLELKELLYPGVAFFIITAGSLAYIAYNKYSLKQAALKTFRRGGELIFIYFLYNIVKLYIYDFSKEPFYLGFINNHTLNLSNILTLHSFTAPISIILTIGALLMTTPFFLFLSRLKYSKIFFGVLISVLIFTNYFLPWPANSLTDFLFAKTNITFPLILWLLPFLIGFYLSMWGFDKHKGKFLLIFITLTAILGLGQLNNFHLIKLYGQMYPLTLFYISLSFSFMFLVIFIFYFLEKAGNKIINSFLSLIRLLGDSTLSVYIYHWIAVDFIIWFIYPQVDSILYTVPPLILVYLLTKQKKFMEYYHSY